MKKISYWALLNPKKTIGLIMLLQALLIVTTFKLAIHLFAHSVLMPEFLIYIGIGLFFISVILYPVRKSRYQFWKANYKKQKLLDLVVVISYILIAGTHTNQEAHKAWLAGDTSEDFVKEISFDPIAEKSIPIVNKKRQSKKETRKLRRSLKKKFKKMIKAAKRNAKNERSQGAKSFGFFLLMIFLVLLLIALSCRIGCNHGTTAGIIAFIFGFSLIILLGILALKKGKLKKRNNYKPSLD